MTLRLDQRSRYALDTWFDKRKGTTIVFNYMVKRLLLRLNLMLSLSLKKFKKRHSENADTSMSVTFDLDKKAYVIRCHLLYYALVSGVMSVNVIVCEIYH